MAGGIYLREHLLVSKALMRHAFIKKWKRGLWLPCVQSIKVSSSERTWHPVTAGGGGSGLGGCFQCPSLFLQGSRTPLAKRLV